MQKNLECLHLSFNGHKCLGNPLFVQRCNGISCKMTDQLDYSLECLQGISDNIPTLAGHGTKFIEIFILKAYNLEVYSISNLPCAQASSHFVQVQSTFSRYKSRNLCQGFIWRFMLLALKKVRSTAAELQRYCSYFAAFESRQLRCKTAAESFKEPSKAAQRFCIPLQLE